MRLFVFCLALAFSTPLIAQSKKTLLAQVEQLKKDNEQLKADVERLKKPKEVVLNDTLQKVSYAIGTLLGANIKAQGGDSLKYDLMSAGIKDVYSGEKLKLEQQEAMMLVNAYMQKAGEAKLKKMKGDNVAFLEKNKSAEGVKTTASGLQYKVINTGKGKAPKATDKVTVHYTGKLIDGTVFDSSIERNEPITFEVGGVITGWTEALQLMHEGDKWMLYLPSDLAYGDGGQGEQIPPYATLVFEVELIKVN